MINFPQSTSGIAGNVYVYPLPEFSRLNPDFDYLSGEKLGIYKNLIVKIKPYGQKARKHYYDDCVCLSGCYFSHIVFTQDQINQAIQSPIDSQNSLNQPVDAQKDIVAIPLKETTVKTAQFYNGQLLKTKVYKELVGNRETWLVDSFGTKSTVKEIGYGCYIVDYHMGGNILVQFLAGD